jgi:hypothetical protein
VSLVVDNVLGRIAEVRKKGFFSVHPRYTCGSGAQVREEIAVRVAREELQAYEHALTGVYGASDQALAQHQGLPGIVEYLVEGKKSWTVYDLCTGEKYDRPFTRHA